LIHHYLNNLKNEMDTFSKDMLKEEEERMIIVAVINSKQKFILMNLK